MKNLMLSVLFVLLCGLLPAQVDSARIEVHYDVYLTFPTVSMADMYLGNWQAFGGMNYLVLRDSGRTVKEIDHKKIIYTNGLVRESLSPGFRLGHIRLDECSGAMPWQSVPPVQADEKEWYNNAIPVNSSGLDKKRQPYRLRRDSSTIYLVVFNDWTEKLERIPYYDLSGAKVKMPPIPEVWEQDSERIPDFTETSELVGQETVQSGDLTFDCYHFRIYRDRPNSRPIAQAVFERFIDRKTLLLVKENYQSPEANYVIQVASWTKT